MEEDSIRPSLFFKLYRTLEGGTAEAVTDADQKEVPKTDGAVEWSDLPATDQNGVTYTYSVKEVDKDGIQLLQLMAIPQNKQQN